MCSGIVQNKFSGKIWHEMGQFGFCTDDHVGTTCSDEIVIPKGKKFRPTKSAKKRKTVGFLPILPCEKNRGRKVQHTARAVLMNEEHCTGESEYFDNWKKRKRAAVCSEIRV